MGGFAVDPEDVAGFATRVLTASQEYGDAMLRAQEHFPAPSAAFGDTPAAEPTYNACQDATEAALATAGVLQAVLEGDADRLYLVAFTTQRTDEEAGGFRGSRLGGDLT
ncbi:hypothetical protein ABZU22_08540 [Micromonospora sp. NPDC005222]|uniref:hypothetical protein n=1 Tax=unclassified Micromonospora TaxID=2617518 RepID=UPI0033B87C54